MILFQNDALDELRGVIPYAHSPSVRKLSKIATLLLAKNYILMQASALEELRRYHVLEYKHLPLYHTDRNYFGLRWNVPINTYSPYIYIHPSLKFDMIPITVFSSKSIPKHRITKIRRSISKFLTYYVLQVGSIPAEHGYSSRYSSSSRFRPDRVPSRREAPARARAWPPATTRAAILRLARQTRTLGH